MPLLLQGCEEPHQRVRRDERLLAERLKTQLETWGVSHKVTVQVVQAQHVLDDGMRAEGQLAQPAQIESPLLCGSAHTFNQVLQSCRDEKPLYQLFIGRTYVISQRNGEAAQAMQYRAIQGIFHKTVPFSSWLFYTCPFPLPRSPTLTLFKLCGGKGSITSVDQGQRTLQATKVELS